MTSILFVCLGNICRSPLAEGICRARLEAAGLAGRVRVDSAGTGDWHVGKPPDPRSVAVARAHGIDLTPLRARQVSRRDFTRFEHILAMDASNLSDLRALSPDKGGARLVRFLDRDVPDPYFGGPDGFEQVFGMLSDGVDVLLADLIERI